MLFGRLDGTGKVCSDPYDWGDRTMKVAENWNALESGDVVDVEYVQPKRSESVTA